MAPRLGCIADDFTGATDLAGMLVKNGLSTLRTIGVPRQDPRGVDSDAIVVALKTRTGSAEDAVAQSVAALDWMRAAGCSTFYFKYCSTFDSTDCGNIGPVAAALMDRLGVDFTIFCPALPVNGRTVFHGHLFIGDTLLAESGMRTHPLTPMTDSNLVRVLQRQTSRKAGLIRYEDVRHGPDAIHTALAKARDAGTQMAVVDAICDEDLQHIAQAFALLPLVTGGSGLAAQLAANMPGCGYAASFPQIAGHSAVISGSCSSATQQQVEIMKQWAPAFHVDPLRLAAGADIAGEAIAWSRARLANGPVLFYSTSDAAGVASAQKELGQPVRPR